MDFKLIISVAAIFAVVSGQTRPGAPLNPNSGRLPVSPNNGNGPPPGNGPAQCAMAGRTAVSGCFQKNGGFQMTYVIAILSNGSQGGLPPNAEQMRSGICKAQPNIIACVFTNINSFRNSQQCPTREDFTRLEQETVGLITSMQQMCGNGPLPSPSRCMNDLNTNMKQCYAKAGLDPNLFTSGGGESQLQGAVIGANRELAKKFCSVRKQLFDCMREVLDGCNGAREVMALSGYDHESLEKGIDVLCHDIGVYVDGLVCFQSPSSEVEGCVNNMREQITDLTAQQIQRSLPLDQFYDRYCQIRLEHMTCDLQGWKSQCNDAAVGLKYEFECNLLPSKCKRNPRLQAQLQEECSIKNFARDKRNSATSLVAFSSLLISVMSVGLVFLL